MEVKNKYVVMNNHVDGAPKESDFSISEEVFSLELNPCRISDKCVVVKNLYVSIDPYQLNRMKNYSSSQTTIAAAAALLPGKVIDANGVGKVVESGHPDFKAGDIVTGLLNWGEYSIVKGGHLLQKLDLALDFPLSYYAGGILGSSGLTAYAGFFHVCKPKKGDKVFVSAAAGSVGVLVGQYAKLFDCYVVGCAGTKHKVDILKEKFGFDDAFNYKEEADLNSALQRSTILDFKWQPPIVTGFLLGLKNQAMKGAIRAAIADGVLTFLWIFCASSLGAATYLVSSTLGVAPGLPTLFVTTFLVFVLLFIFGFIGDFLGGATFNPTATAAFYAAGLGGSDSLVSAAVRFPAQAAGAVGGVIAVMEVMPAQYKHMLGGPSLKVDLHTGAIAEGVLTFIITFAVLFIVIKGPANIIIKNWLLAMSTVTLVVAGSSYTGPSMNPANAFGWAYVNNTHNTWEQFYVYWICPFVGAILAAWVFRFIFPPPTKQKKA